VIYNTAEGLWGIDASGDPILLLDQPEARLSPDGSQAAYVFYDGEGAYDIWLANLATGEQRNLTNTPDRFEANPMWWPGGPGVLVFGSDTQMGMASAGYPTTVGLDGSGYAVLDPEEGGPIALSSIGQMIAYGGYDSPGKIHHWTWKVGPEVFDPATFGLSAEKLYQPAWSPNGRYLAWEVGGDLAGEGKWQMGVAVFDMLLDTANLLHVYEPAAGGEFPHYLAWSPDGGRLAFVTFGEPPATGRLPNLWIIDPETGDEVYVAAGTDPTWSPQGDRLAFSRSEEETLGIAVADTITGQILEVDLPTAVRFVTGWIDPQLLQVSPSTSIPPAGAPAPCVPPGETLRAYFDPQGRYCLLYPATFRIADVAPGRVGFYGPPLDESIEPVFGALVVHVEDLPAGRTLAEVVDDHVAQYGDAYAITRVPTTLDGEPAEQVEGVGEMFRGRAIFALHDDLIYHLAFYPVDDRFPQAAPDVEAIWRTVTESFTFTTSLLPRSMKGYELYSWYVAEADAWYYTLVTGTNRAKSYAELSTLDSVITKEGWVKLTVKGESALRATLSATGHPLGPGRNRVFTGFFAYETGFFLENPVSSSRPYSHLHHEKFSLATQS
jgi:hypothetical protein